ncbi:MAG TPA: nuclear transport factor 2 family protein [Acidobacteriota bacterium]|jgi:ketosteroid isomerase-like protein|nr:nuclear transport factor 2 family protein [Acidobacteriota bacterium]
MERDRVEAIKRSDMKALDRIYAPEYTAIVSLRPGKVVSKAEELAVQGPDLRQLQSWEPSDVAIRIYGNVGLVTGLGDLKDVLRGERRHVRVQYSHVWVKRDDGSWQLVHRHVNRVATLEGPTPPR